MPYNRFESALFMQGGACNPSGIINALHKAKEEFLTGPDRDTVAMKDDPAIRLIAHQLAYILRLSEIDMPDDTYRRLMGECAQKSSGEVVSACNAEHYLPKDPVKPAPVQFERITENRYYEYMNVLPPRAMHEGKFLVGEPQSHNEQGMALYQMCAWADGSYYASAKGVTVKQYQEITQYDVLQNIIPE